MRVASACSSTRSRSGWRAATSRTRSRAPTRWCAAVDSGVTADALEPATSEAAVVRVGRAEDQRAQAAQRVGGGQGGGPRRAEHQAHQIVVAHRFLRQRVFAVEPAVPAVPGRIDPVPGEAAPQRAIAAILQPLPVPPHIGGAPGRIAGQRGDAVPVAVMRRYQDHRIVRGAAAQRAGTRVQNPLRTALAVAPLLCVVGIMADEKIPAHRRMFGGERVKCRHLVGFGQPGGLGVQRIAARFEQNDAHASLGEPGGERAAAGSRADHDIIAVGVRFRRHPDADGSERLQELDEGALILIAERGFLVLLRRPEIMAAIDDEIGAFAQLQHRLPQIGEFRAQLLVGRAFPAATADRA